MEWRHTGSISYALRRSATWGHGRQIRGKVVEGRQHSNVRDFVRSRGPLIIAT